MGEDWRSANPEQLERLADLLDSLDPESVNVKATEAFRDATNQLGRLGRDGPAERVT
jgi:hypothetical protein